MVANIGDLSGNIVIDPTNSSMVGDCGLRDFAVEPLQRRMYSPLATAATSSKGDQHHELGNHRGPGFHCRVGHRSHHGDDPEAKAAVSVLIEGMVLEPINLGPVRYAHMVEGMYIVWGNCRALGNPCNC